MRPPRSELTPDALAWIATIERLFTARGMTLDEELGEKVDGPGCTLMFHYRTTAKGHPGLLRYVEPIAARLGLTLAEIEAAGPIGVA